MRNCIHSEALAKVVLTAAARSLAACPLDDAQDAAALLTTLASSCRPADLSKIVSFDDLNTTVEALADLIDQHGDTLERGLVVGVDLALKLAENASEEAAATLAVA